MRFFIVAVLFCLAVSAIPAESCKPKQELVDGVCVRRCGRGQSRNAAGDCKKDCMKNATLQGKYTCVCNAGFDRYKRKCLPACGENMRRKAGKCTCKRGFSLMGNACVAAGCPTNEERRGSKCYCVKGTSRINGVCSGPCAENQRRVNGVCECKKYYELFQKKCVRKCGLNSRRKVDGTCICLLGFEEKADGKCRKIRCPRHEQLRGNKCYCRSGFHRIGGTCVKFNRPTKAPATAAPTPACPTSGICVGGIVSGCVAGFDLVGSQCYPACGANSVRSGTACTCAGGFELVAGQCLTSCPGNSYRSGTTCACNGGWEMIGNVCYQACMQNARRVGTQCQCNHGYRMNNGRCEQGCRFMGRMHTGGDDIQDGIWNISRDDCVNRCRSMGNCMATSYDSSNRCWLHHRGNVNNYSNACGSCEFFVKNC